MQSTLKVAWVLNININKNIKDELKQVSSDEAYFSPK